MRSTATSRPAAATVWDSPVTEQIDRFTYHELRDEGRAPRRRPRRS
jgi:hypothetical protein